MRKVSGIVWILILFLPVYGLATRTLTFPLFQWDRISEYELSNIVLSSTGDMTLSPSFSPLFTADQPLWCTIGWKKYLLAGTGGGASLLWFDGTSIQSNTFPDHEILTALATDDRWIYAGAVPHATLFLINEQREIAREFSLGPTYIWSIVPSPQGVWILTGEPAEIYLLKGDTPKKIASLPTERHLLKGVWTENGLFCIGESSLLYLLPPSSPNIRAVAEFSDPIQDIAADKTSLYVGINKSSSRNKRQNDDNDTTEIVIYRYLNQTPSVLTRIPGARLSQMLVWQDTLYLGSYQNFFLYNLKENTLQAAGYGKGGVRLFGVARDNLTLITENPSRILQMGTSTAREGSLITPLFDASQKANWGSLLGLSSPPSLVSIVTRSSLSPLPNLFEDWSPYQNQVTSSPNRYLQLQIITKNRTPISLREATIAASQINQAPEILNFSVSQQNARLLVSWNVRDPNQDALFLRLCIKRQSGWVPIFSSPLTNTSFECSARMFPEGKYTFLLTVDDSPSNPPSTTLSDSRESGFITIDHTPPQIRNLKATVINKTLQCEWIVSDTSGISRVWYSTSPDQWIPILPDRGFFGGGEERFSLSLPEFSGGYLQIKAEDAYGNENVYGQWITP